MGFGRHNFSELLVFENKSALDQFKEGKLNFAADASAVVLKSGVATNATFVNGVAVMVSPIGGAMLEAAIGGSSSPISRSEASVRRRRTGGRCGVRWRYRWCCSQAVVVYDCTSMSRN